MDIQAYIASGILEEYVLGHLDEARHSEVARLCKTYPELAAARDAIEECLFLYASSKATTPPFHLQEQIWHTLDNLNKERAIDPNNLPLINAFTNTDKWLALVKPIIPTQLADDRTMHVLRDTPQVIQMFVISKTDFVDEIHDDLLESFIILEGECECTVGDEVFRLGAGGYAAIPLHTPHTVRILSPYVMAIMQRVAV